MTDTRCSTIARGHHHSGARTRLVALLLLCVGILVTALAGCQGAAPATNTDPTLSVLTVTPSSALAPGGTATIAASATDADGDALTYAWSAAAGTLGGTGASVTWTAPTVAGQYTVTCFVSDGRGGTATRTATLTVTALARSNGRIVYATADGGIYRIEATEGATPENLTTALDTLAAGTEDQWVNVSPDGEWLAVQTDRFDADAAGWPGLALVAGDLSSFESVRTPDGLVHTEGFGCVASGGDLIVYAANGGPHDLDLWSIERSGSAWAAPTLLTASSPYAFNSQPAISDDGNTVLFDAGAEPYAPGSTAVCEVGTDGTGFRTILTVTDSPTGLPDTGSLHQADYAPDGSIVFEGNWGFEAVWRLPAGSTTPVRLNAGETNDNSPCVLPDGRIVSLYLERDGNAEGVHEIKILSADGSSSSMLLTGVDIVDGGIGCGL